MTKPISVYFLSDKYTSKVSKSPQDLTAMMGLQDKFLVW